MNDNNRIIEIPFSNGFKLLLLITGEKLDVINRNIVVNKIMEKNVIIEFKLFLNLNLFGNL